MIEGMVLEFDSGIPVYKQIINRVRTEVASGNMAGGDKLPTIRKLTEILKITPNTVAKAYRELELSGVIVSKCGRGSFISESAKQENELSKAEKENKITQLFERLMSEASGFGISEDDVMDYLTTRT